MENMHLMNNHRNLIILVIVSVLLFVLICICFLNTSEPQEWMRTIFPLFLGWIGFTGIFSKKIFFGIGLISVLASIAAIYNYEIATQYWVTELTAWILIICLTTRICVLGIVSNRNTVFLSPYKNRPDDYNPKRFSRRH